MNKRTKKKKNDGNEINNNSLHDIIGRCIEALCLHQAKRYLDISNKADGQGDAAELLKLVQLLEKYLTLRERAEPEQVEQTEEIAIDYRLLRDYLERKTDDDAR